MVDNRTTTPNKNTPIKGGGFTKKNTFTDEQLDDAVVPTKAVVESVPPVAFTDLFR
jgi:hypothetical protein